MRFVFWGADGGSTVVAILIQTLLSGDRVCNGARVDGQTVIMADAAQLCRLFAIQIELEQTIKLAVPVLLHHVDTRVPPNEIRHIISEGVGANSAVTRFD